MPISVRVVTDEEFAEWLAKTKPAAAIDGDGKVATAQD